MNTRPMLFSGAMVRAILQGRKTQTRRLIKPQFPIDVTEVGERPAIDPVLGCVVSGHSGLWEDCHGLDEVRRCPYGLPGDLLWVKETWCVARHHDRTKPTELPERRMTVVYDAGGHSCNVGVGGWRHLDEWPSGVPFGKLRPSIFMRRWMSRIDLEVQSIRVQRLNDITEEDARSEGADPLDMDDILREKRDGLLDVPLKEIGKPYRNGFASLWESIHGPNSWASNPWVWVVAFKHMKEVAW